MSDVRRLHIIINPAAGRERPILGVMNRAFQQADIDWDVSITKHLGDAEEYARRAAANGADIVAVYGGDGTVMEAASGLIGSDVPLAILPGGTANVISRELQIPNDLAEACATVCAQDRATRSIDVGRVGDRYFLIRVGLGFEAEMIDGADRSLKDKLGILAYGLAAIRALSDPLMACYHLELDGRSVETEGITCIIANTGSFGQLDMRLAPTISIADGLLDVIVVRKSDLKSLLTVAASIVTGSSNAEPLQHWKAREVTVVAEPQQIVQLDGEVIEPGPLTARAIPHAVRVIVPRSAAAAAEDAAKVRQASG